jgi:hypothetical protein
MVRDSRLASSGVTGKLDNDIENGGWDGKKPIRIPNTSN